MSRVSTLISDAHSRGLSPDAMNSLGSGKTKSRDRADVDRWVSLINAELLDDDETLPEIPPPASSKPSMPNASCDETTTLVTIEYGRTSVRESACSWNSGELIPLDQFADEPLDIVADGRAIAKGEMVLIDGKIGIRIVELLSCLLLAALFVPSVMLAEERTRERPSAFQFNSEGDSLIKLTDLSGEAIESSNVFKPQSESVPLTPPSASRRSFGNAHNQESNRVSMKPAGWGTAMWSLLIISGLITLAARWFKTHSPMSRGLPAEAFEILGRRAIDQRNSVLLARCGARLLLLSSSPAGLQTLTEITDPVEIDCLAGLCHANQNEHSLAETWRSFLQRPSAKKPFQEPVRDHVATAAVTEPRWVDQLLTNAASRPLGSEARK